MNIANTPAAELHQRLTKAVNWETILPEKEVVALESIINQLGQFPGNMAIFHYPYAAPENRYVTVTERMDFFGRRLQQRKRQLVH